MRKIICCSFIMLAALGVSGTAKADECIHVDGPSPTVACHNYECSQQQDGLWACSTADAAWLTDCPTCVDVTDGGSTLEAQPFCRIVVCPKIPVDVPGICCDSDEECCEFVITAPAGWDPRWKGYCWWDGDTQICINEKERCTWTPSTGVLQCKPRKLKSKL